MEIDNDNDAEMTRWGDEEYRESDEKYLRYSLLLKSVGQRTSYNLNCSSVRVSN